LNESTRTVLIVDDSLTVRMDLCEAFSASGFQTLPCRGAAEAREALARQRVALVVLDVCLPDADGVELLTELRAHPAAAHAPILMLTSAAEIEDRIRGLRTGADEYIGKPYDRRYVVARAQELMSMRHAAGGNRQASVLVIDDSPTFRAALASRLEASGYVVSLAGTGEDGLRQAAVERPGAIVVDGVLPAMDGAAVIRSIRLDESLRGTPCVVLTGSDDRAAELRALDAGADAFCRKEEDFEPILARLAAAIRGHVGGRRSTASLLGPKRILAVDDSPTYLNELGDVLRGEGYDVVLARGGEEALAILAVQPVDCVLLDVMMPGLDGRETCQRIKSSPGIRDTPLILLTAYDERDALLEGLAAGADDYIAKSADFEVLKARVRAQLRRKQFEDENRSIRQELLQSELDAAKARAAHALAETRAALVEQLEQKNKELEAFSYSVSHDLRTPLRSIDGFSQALLEDCGEKLDETGREHLARIRVAAQRMGELIDDLLSLSRVSRSDLHPTVVSLSDLARSVSDEMRLKPPLRQAEWVIAPDLVVEADARLLRVLLENLLGNAWKFTSNTPHPRIEVTWEGGVERRYLVRDNGVGFEMKYARKLFNPFQRLHSDAEFPGTGIGLATVRRIVERHGGVIGADSEPNRGATFWFTLPRQRNGDLS
jgi:two-component system, NtrC family, sensor kinase